MKISTRWLVFSIVLGGYATLIIPGLTLDKLDAALRWPDSSVQPPTKFVVHELVAAKLAPKKAGGQQRVLPLVLSKWLGPRVTDSSTEWSAQTDPLWFEFLRAAGALVVFSPGEPRGGMIEWIFAPATAQLSKAVVPEGRAVRHLNGELLPDIASARRRVAASIGVDPDVWVLYPDKVIQQLENALQAPIAAQRGAFLHISRVRYRWSAGKTGLTPLVISVE
jgi:hypothetical protein